MTKSQIYLAVKQPRSNHLAIRGVDYHILEWGSRDNPLLVMLHGWGDCAASFQFVVDRFARDWFVVAPDWRGFGRSHYRCESYWFPDYLADLDALLQHYQPDAPLNLLGHSMGANIAGLYAGIFPERVETFVNVEGFGLADGDASNAPAHYRRWIIQSRALPVYATYDRIEQLCERILKRSPGMSHEKAMFVAQHWSKVSKDGRIELLADPAHKLPNAVQYRRSEAQACWSQVTARVLLVIGKDTDFTGAAKSWIDDDEATRPFRNERACVIPGSGHMVHFEQPGRLAEAVEGFLDDAQKAVVQ